MYIQCSYCYSKHSPNHDVLLLPGFPVQQLSSVVLVLSHNIVWISHKNEKDFSACKLPIVRSANHYLTSVIGLSVVICENNASSNCKLILKVVCRCSNQSFFTVVSKLLSYNVHVYHYANKCKWWQATNILVDVQNLGSDSTRNQPQST